MDDDGIGGLSADEVLRMVADIVAAYVGHHSIDTSQVPELIRTVHGALSGAQQVSPPAALESAPKPAVAIRRSVTDEYIICLEDGRKLKMLKRYLRTKYGMTPEQYRTRWGLAADYPMVAPNYSNQRSNFAKKIGLGRRRG